MNTLTATDLAVEKLGEYLKANAITSAVRVFLQQGGCSGPTLSLALDEEKPGDVTCAKNGVSFLVEEALLAQCGGLTVEYVDAGARSGFMVRPEIPIAGGGCSSCSSGGCGCDE
ncbi:MAG: IscA/HesB family protein [Desulfobulbaceae bacterium]|nr:IscA/HesB family protein [Desulfobulbaceae bacterium]